MPCNKHFIFRMKAVGWALPTKFEAVQVGWWAVPTLLFILGMKYAMDEESHAHTGCKAVEWALPTEYETAQVIWCAVFGDDGPWIDRRIVTTKEELICDS